MSKNTLIVVILAAFAAGGCSATLNPDDLKWNGDADGGDIDGGDGGSNPCIPDPCNGHGDCTVNASNEPVCDCVEGWSGANCATENCPAGKCQSPQTCRLSDGVCVDPANPCIPDPCLGHGACNSSDGSCTCSNNWTGATCATCPTGSYVNGSSQCVDDPCQPNICQNGGSCSRPTGTAVCTCSGNWTGATCTVCPAGYTGADCHVDLCYNVSCSGHGTCNASDGSCTCNNNWSGSTCATCPSGSYVYAGNCVDNPCIPDVCSGHGTCSNGTGAAVCSCTPNWTGTDCSSCPAGSFVFAGNCIDDPCLPTNPCLNGGTCGNSTGVAVCTCPTGFDPSASCGACASGYLEYPACFAYPGKAVVAPNTPQVTTLVTGSNDALKFKVSATGGPVAMAKMAFSISVTGGAAISAIVLNNGTADIPYSTVASGTVVFGFATEENVVVGTPKNYVLKVTLAGVMSGNSLAVSLLGDATPSPGLTGMTGYVYNSGGDSLFSSSNGLCGVGAPNFVWNGATAHTAPTPTCSITSVGTSNYTDGSQATWTPVSNTLTAP